MPSSTSASSIPSAPAVLLDPLQIQGIAETLPQLVWTARPDGYHEYFNARWYEYTGLTPETSLGEGWRNGFHPQDVPLAEERWRESLKTGTSYEVQYRCRRHDGAFRWHLGRAHPMRDASGRIVRWFGTCTDIEDQKRNEEHAAFLSEATELLSSSLEMKVVLADLVRLAVPKLADWCAIDLLKPDGSFERVEVAHPDPEMLQFAIELSKKTPIRIEDPTGTGAVVRERKSQLMPYISDELLVQSLPDPELLEAYRKLGLRSAITVPLVARGIGIGALTLVQSESGRLFDGEDLAHAEDLARRAALAYDNATLYQQAQDSAARAERDKSIAQTLSGLALALGSELDPDRLVQTVTDEATRLTGAQFGALFHNRVNDRGESYMLYTISGVEREAFSKFPMPRNTGIFAPTFEGKGTVRYGDVTKAEAFGKNPPYNGMPKGHLPVRSYLAVPVRRRGGGVLGGLFFGHSEPDRFTEAHERLIEGIAAHAAVAIESASLHEQARRMEERYRSLVSATSQVVWSTDSRGKIVEDSPTWRAFTGQSQEEFLAGRWLEAIHPDDRGRTGEAWDAALRAGTSFEMDYRLRRADGAWAYTFVRATPVVAPSGQVREWIGCNIDVTEKRRVDEEREHLIGLLERSNRDLDQFAYVASHDLKAPLRGIANLSQWIEEDLGTDVSPSLRQQLDLLRGRVKRLEALIDGILSYSRAGRVQTIPEEVDSRVLVQEAVDLLAPPETVKVEIDKQLPKLRTERVPLQQVFLNLIGNAVKYSKRTDVVIRVDVQDAGAFWEFAVSDNGVGIPAEYHARIWGIFQRLEARDDVEGTGIGLSVVKKTVETRGGHASVESVEGAGATFRFTWPKRMEGGARG